MASRAVPGGGSGPAEAGLGLRGTKPTWKKLPQRRSSKLEAGREPTRLQCTWCALRAARGAPVGPGRPVGCSARQTESRRGVERSRRAVEVSRAACYLSGVEEGSGAGQFANRRELCPVCARAR